VETLGDAQGVRELIGQCLSGDRGAGTRFQDTYGELIYGFPIRAYRTPPEDAGDFYVFVFSDGRIFRRSRTYEGRAPFRAYLVGSVLPHLVLEWRRGKHDIETEEFDEGCGDGAVAVSNDPDGTGDESMDLNWMRDFLESAGAAKAVILKLLHIEDFDLSPAEIRYLAKTSGRSVADLLEAIGALQATVQSREAAAKGIEEKLDAVQAWIYLYERRLSRIVEEMSALPPTSMAAARLREERAEVEGKIERRRQQRDKVLARGQRRKVTAPYKEIAALLNTTVGNVSSQIARLLQEIRAAAASHAE